MTVFRAEQASGKNEIVIVTGDLTSPEFIQSLEDHARFGYVVRAAFQDGMGASVVVLQVEPR